jgi:uncharacterized membrane protein
MSEKLVRYIVVPLLLAFAVVVGICGGWVRAFSVSDTVGG